MSNFAGLAIDGGDPRLDAVNNTTDEKLALTNRMSVSMDAPPAYEVSKKVLRVRDPNVSWEEYVVALTCRLEPIAKACFICQIQFLRQARPHRGRHLKG